MQLTKQFIPDTKKTTLSRIKNDKNSSDFNAMNKYAKDSFQKLYVYKDLNAFRKSGHVLWDDTPKTILKRFWLQFHSKKDGVVIMKSPAKDGGCNWALLHFKVKLDKKGEIFSFAVKKEEPQLDSILEINKLYRKLLSIEKTMGVDVSEKYLTEFLKDTHKSYEEYIKGICTMQNL